jgi:hypothetical protein
MSRRSLEWRQKLMQQSFFRNIKATNKASKKEEWPVNRYG